MASAPMAGWRCGPPYPHMADIPSVHTRADWLGVARHRGWMLQGLTSACFCTRDDFACVQADMSSLQR
jgi:hypothetical protein